MKTFDEALDAYFEYFGVHYPYAIGVGFPGKTDAENIAIIERCIRENKSIHFTPEYIPECDY